MILHVGNMRDFDLIVSQVIGRRKRAAAEAEVLVRWKPRL